MMDILAELHMARLRDQNWDNHLDMLMELFWVLQFNTLKYIMMVNLMNHLMWYHWDEKMELHWDIQVELQMD